MSFSLITQKRQNILFVSAKFGLMLLLTEGIQKILSSAALERWTGFEFVQATGINASPMDWLVILFFLFILSTYSTYEEADRKFPHCAQCMFACVGILAVSVMSFVLTHPSHAIFTRMTAFIVHHPLVGGPLFGSYLASTMTIGILPLYFLLFPADFIHRYRKKALLVFFGLETCLFVTVPEAIYHSFFSPYLMNMISAIVQLFSLKVVSDPVKSILSVNHFLVRIGPACSGLSLTE